MINNKLTLSIIICAYTEDRWSDLIRAMSSVQRQTTPADEIILVIDHNPELYERSKDVFVRVKVVENLEERGLSGARNSGIKMARGEVIAFMDEDAVASSNWIESLLRGYTNDVVMGVGGVVRPLWTGNTPGWFPQEFNWVVGCSYKGLPETAAPIRNPIGCNMSFRREALVASGGFRNGIGRIGVVPVGCEETELSIRMHQIYPEKIILFEPGAVVYHRVPVWRMTWKYFAYRCVAEGLSKAQVTQYVGSGDGLASERSYAAVTLPAGMVEGFRESIQQRNITGLLRAGCIGIGLSLTTIGYLIGAISKKRNQLLSPRQMVFSSTLESKKSAVVGAAQRMDSHNL